LKAVTSFVFSSCDFVDRSFLPEKQGRSTKSHELTRTKILEVQVTFGAKPILEANTGGAAEAQHSTTYKAKLPTTVVRVAIDPVHLAPDRPFEKFQG